MMVKFVGVFVAASMLYIAWITPSLGDVLRPVLVLTGLGILVWSLMPGEDPKVTALRKAKGEKWMEQKRNEADVIVLTSGLCIKKLTRKLGYDENKLKSPSLHSDCAVHYEGKLPDGSKFDSSYDRGFKPVVFKPSQVVPGWTEALQLMCEGDIWELYIPYQLGYGSDGSPPVIPSYSPLQFKIELLKVGENSKTKAEAEQLLESARVNKSKSS